MRLLQVVTADSRLLDLHPQMSVVADVDPATRAHLAAVVRALARQEAVGQGLVEAHGILFDLEPDLLGLLGPGRADVDPVIRSTDLPGAGAQDEPLLVARAAFADLLERLSAAVAGQERVDEQLEATAAARAEADAALVEAMVALEAAEQAVADRRAEDDAAAVRAEAVAAEAEAVGRRADDAIRTAEAAVAAAARERAEAEARVVEAVAAVTRLEAEWEALRLEEQQATERLDEASAADLESARSALQVSEAALIDDQPHHDPPAAPAAPVGGALAPDPGEGPTRVELIARLALLDELLAELIELDRGPVEAASDALRAEVPLVASPEATELAEQLSELDAEITAVETAGVPEVSAEEAAAASDRLDRARLAVADAEDAARTHHLDPADAAALEAAHDALHDALERSDARFGGRSARAKVDRLRAEEQGLLDRLGFRSFADYLMGTGAAHRDAGAEAALAEARSELAGAEAAADEVDERRAVVLDHAARLDHRRRLVDAAAALLGRPVGTAADVVSMLRDHRVPARSQEAAARALAQALAAAGLDLGDAGDLDPEDLVLVADAWVVEATAADERRAELSATRAEVEAALTAAGAGPDAPFPETPVVASSDLAAAEARFKVHEAARIAVEAAAADRLRVEASLIDAEETRRAAEAALSDAEAGEEAARQLLASLAPGAGAQPDGQPGRGLLGAPSPVEGELVDPAGPVDLETARAALAAAQTLLAGTEADHEAARRAAEASAADIAALEAEGEVAARELEELEERHATQVRPDAASDAEELEWYLMARLAAQRSVGVAGSAPLLLDDPFGDLGDGDVHHLLGQLERMAESVQVIVVSDHPAVGAWAEEAGEARAAVVTPIAT